MPPRPLRRPPGRIHAAPAASRPVSTVPRRVPVSTEDQVPQVLAINLAEPYALTPADLAPTDLSDAASHVVYEGWGAAANLTVSTFDSWTLPACNSSDFRLAHVAPVFSNGWAYLGEPAKWVPVAEARTLSVAVDGDGVSVELAGAAGEAVALAFYAPNGTVVGCATELDAAGGGGVRVGGAGGCA